MEHVLDTKLQEEKNEMYFLFSSGANSELSAVTFVYRKGHEVIQT